VAIVTGEGKRAVGYVRVSTREQAQEGVSLAAQDERIRAFCTAKGWELLRVYRDEGESGKDLDRPGVQTMIRDLKSNGAGVVVILKLDRLTRSVRDLGTLIEDLFGGVALAAVDGSLDSSTAGGRMVVNLLGSVAQWERETTVERTVAALDYKRSRGEWLGRIPFGFRIGEDGKLAEDPEAMRVVAAIKRSRRRSGTSYPKLAKQYGLAVGTVYKLCTTDLRVLRREVAA
jgi:DNA invertase Pin-like site-specific DNA recombinase